MRARVAGFTYLTILFVVAFMGIGLAVAGQVWHTQAMRDREAELLYAGNQYRRAIERYYLLRLHDRSAAIQVNLPIEPSRRSPTSALGLASLTHFNPTGGIRCTRAILYLVSQSPYLF